MEKYISMLLAAIVLTTTTPNISKLPKDDSYTAMPLNDHEPPIKDITPIE